MEFALAFSCLCHIYLQNFLPVEKKNLLHYECGEFLLELFELGLK